MLKITQVNMIDVQDWDNLVTKTYGKIYNFQQQDGCKSRGTFELRVPSDPYDFENDTLPEEVNHSNRGVSFKAWLERDPKQPLSSGSHSDQWGVDLWWSRNFYPDISMIANDLHSRGLVPAGKYVINIDW